MVGTTAKPPRLNRAYLTCAGGILLDASVTGGHIGLDTEHNEALYGSGLSAAQILEGSDAPEPPPAFKPVYELINSIVARAASDQRKFSGFEKHWAPQVCSCAVLRNRCCLLSSRGVSTGMCIGCGCERPAFGTSLKKCGG